MNNNKKIRSGFKKDGMFNEANPLVFELAKNLRRNMTDAEMILWQHLKAGINGIKFRRQHPIGIYVADFYCHKIKLIIEIDGSIHHKKEIKDYDIKRENDLKCLIGNWLTVHSHEGLQRYLSNSLLHPNQHDVRGQNC